MISLIQETGQADTYESSKVRYKDRIRQLIMPKDYQSSVSEGYVKFTKASIYAAFFCSVATTLGFGSLLQSGGKGDTGTSQLPLILNFLVKDILGDLLTIIYGAFWSDTREFDNEPATHYFIAAVLMDIGILLQSLTLLSTNFIQYLTLASLGGFFISISCLSTSATKATIHKSFMKGNISNLSDITSKNGSQEILTGIFGAVITTSLSYLVSLIFPGTNMFLTYPYELIFINLLLLSIHLQIIYFSLDDIKVNSLNPRRLITATFDSIILTGEKITLNPMLSPSSIKSTQFVNNNFQAKDGKVCFWLREPLERKKSGESERLLRPLDIYIKLGRSIDTLDTKSRTWLQKYIRLLPDQCERNMVLYFIVHDKSSTCHTFSILFIKGANQDTLIEAYLSVMILTHMLLDTGEASVEVARRIAQDQLPKYVKGVEEAGWDKESLLLEPKRCRVSLG